MCRIFVLSNCSWLIIGGDPARPSLVPQLGESRPPAIGIKSLRLFLLDSATKSVIVGFPNRHLERTARLRSVTVTAQSP